MTATNMCSNFSGFRCSPPRGDGPHNDLDSNFYQLLLLRAEDFQGINVFIEKKMDEIHFSWDSEWITFNHVSSYLWNF